MKEPTPYEFIKHPELGVLAILEAVLLIADIALITGFPKCGDEDLENTDLDAYAGGITRQLRSLEWTIGCYRQNLKSRSNGGRSCNAKRKNCGGSFLFNEKT
jgi:hypothetical protein